MALQGSLETVRLADVLALLASTAQTGELTVSGRDLDGNLWFADGELVGSSVGRAGNHAEALFNLLRIHGGTFYFESGRPTISGAPAEIGPLLTEAERLSIEWSQVEATVQSMEARVRMVPDLLTPEVTVGGEQWRILAAAAGGATIQRVLDALSFSEVDGCRAIQAMVTSGLVTVEQPTSVEAEAAHDALVSASGPDVWLPVVPASRTPARPSAESAAPAWTRTPSDPTSEGNEGDDEIDADAAMTASGSSGFVPNAPATVTVPAAGSSGPAAAPGETDHARDERIANTELARPIQRGALLKFLSSVRT